MFSSNNQQYSVLSLQLQENKPNQKMSAPASLPLGFAEQVMDLQIKLEDQQSLEVIQILSQMYRIAVDFYIENDVKKASYFQKKLNNLVIKSLNANSVENPKLKRSELPNKIKRQLNLYEQNGKTYIQGIVENNERAQKKIRSRIQQDINRQQQKLKGRMLRRVKSTDKL